MQDKGLNPHDGIFFLPGEDDDEMCLEFFNFKDDMAGGTLVEANEIGPKYHIAFFRKDEEGNPVFDEHFEAIFGDPEAYLTKLTGCGLYGCMVKKTTKSAKWFEDYLNKAFASVRIEKLKQIAGAIANT